MANIVEICNLALSHIGKRQIDSLTEATPAAQACSLHFPIIRDATLRDFPWNFANKRLALALTTEEVSGWDYVYERPTDCLDAKRIWNPLEESRMTGGNYLNGVYVPLVAPITVSKIPFEITLNEDSNRQRILTNQESAVLIYTAKVTDPTMYDSLFVSALSYALASELAIPLMGDPQLQVSMHQNYLMRLSRAQTNNANEQAVIPSGTSSYEAARM